MAKIILNKETLNKNQYQKVIDTSFTQLVQPTPVTPESIPSISVAEFFNNYQEIFFQIPKFGNINSHEYIIKTSQEYLGSDPLTDSTIQALIEEITQLRQENLEFQQQIISGTIQ
jgi:hypothetical protein